MGACHPSRLPRRDLDAVRTRLKASRDVERQALNTLKEFPNIELTSFAGLESTGLESRGTGKAAAS
jgi:hypothetical protein